MAEHDADADRITRLEEALLFSERRTDQLHEEVLGLSALLGRVIARVSALERQTLLQSPDAEPDGPTSDSPPPPEPD